MGSGKTTTYPLKLSRPALVSALLVGRYLFIITLLFAWACYSRTTETLTLLQNGELPVFEGMLSGFFATNVVLSLLDGRSRFQNYKRVKDQLYLHSVNARYLQAVAISRCQREAAMVAATELGMASEVKAQFQKLGYRWYHFIPDFFFARPFFLTDLHFWKHTFFVPHYTPRFDYRKISVQHHSPSATIRKRPCQAIRVH